jgi:spore maturation protein CgeB
VEKVEYYLNHDDEREAITLAGHHRSQIAGYNYNKAAEEVVRYHSERL